jgi:hypothetical protein
LLWLHALPYALLLTAAVRVDLLRLSGTPRSWTAFPAVQIAVEVAIGTGVGIGLAIIAGIGFRIAFGVVFGIAGGIAAWIFLGITFGNAGWIGSAVGGGTSRAFRDRGVR